MNTIDEEIAEVKAQLKAMGITSDREMRPRMNEPEVERLHDELMWLNAFDIGVCIGWDPDGQ